MTIGRGAAFQAILVIALWALVALTFFENRFPGGAVPNADRAIAVASETCGKPVGSWRAHLSGGSWIVSGEANYFWHTFRRPEAWWWMEVDARSGRVIQCHVVVI